ncbi:MAG: TIGR02453 family protein, partial [Pseudomonadota bacterium]
MNQFTGFKPNLVRFLKQLEKNNDRAWFQENKHRYESDVLAPALEFIDAMATPLHKISPHFNAIPKRMGGSLMRVYRDTRFSKDKTPYKTNVGIQFRHQLGKDVHAPGYYFHIDPKSVFIGVGIWHPENKTLAKIRD